MNENRASSGVRNLRAMFENQSATSSPEPRGRSPSRRLNTDVNRPTSKVKASFVPVESNTPRTPTSPSLISPPLGTIKGTADGRNSLDAQRRESFSISDEAGAEAVQELRQVVSQEKEAREQSEDIPEAIPEEAISSRDASITPPSIHSPDAMPNLGTIMKGSDFPEPDVTPKQKQAKQELPVKETPEEKTPVQEQTPVKENPAKEEPAVAKETAAAPSSEPAADADESLEGQLAALSLSDLPPDNPDKVVTGVQEEATLKPADPKDEATVSSGHALSPSAEVLPSANAPVTPEQSKEKPTNAKTSSGPKKPSPISVSKAAHAGAPSKSPMPRSPGGARLPKTPTTPKSATRPNPKGHTPNKEAPKEQSKAAPPKAAARAPASKPSARVTSTTTTASAAAKAKAPVEDKKGPTKAPTAAPASKSSVTTSPGGFKKPKPKSPTRPVRLPSHLTAPTAASAAKHGDAPVHKPAPKNAAPKPPPAKTAPTTRKPSAPRSSVAATSAAAKRPVSRASTAGGADDSFLARMMRPTASSASKVHEKPSSPPRRTTSVRTSSKPRTGQQGVVAKAKIKVEELATKAKEVVSNGREEHAHHEEADATSGASQTGAEERKQPTEQQHDTVPTEQAEAPVAEERTPAAEGQAVH